MKTLATSFILGSLVLAVCLPLVTFAQPIPKKLQNAVGEVVVNTTTCTVTCGLGYKEETVCEVGPDGVRRKCRTQRSECLSTWICGMLHFTVSSGKEYELICLSADILEIGLDKFRFSWRIARGIISIDDEVFKPFISRSYFVKFKSIQEYDSGTYRCDVQLLKNLRFVKRVYFGLKVLSSKLVHLDFHQSLTEEQKLADEGLQVNLGNYSRPPHLPWRRDVATALGIGIASGVIGGVLVIFVVSSGLRVVYRNASDET